MKIAIGCDEAAGPMKDAIKVMLQAQGHEVTKAMVRLPQGPLKQVGDYPITLDLNADVTTTITVSVLGDTSN